MTPDQTGDPLVLALEGALVTGGPAEALEEDVQTALARGYRHVVMNLTKVSYLDSTGIRALVRSYTSARRLGGRFALVAPGPRVARLLEITRLDTIFEIHDTIAAALGDPQRGL